MSKPRYRWWGYIKSIIRNYPALEGRYCQGTSLKERMAVQRSIEQTERMENGKERLQVVDLVFFKQTHTLEGAAMMVPCHYETARHWHSDFIKLVAQNLACWSNTHLKSQTLDVGWRRGGVYLCASFSTARHRGG